MFKKLFASCTSACFEFENDTPYRYPAGKYTIFLNGVKVGEGDTNVFSIYGLQPSADYSVTVLRRIYCNSIEYQKSGILS